MNEDIEHTCDLFLASSEEVRLELVNKVVRGISFLFLNFSSRMAISAVRTKNENELMRGLAALAIENGTPDWRDTMICLSMLYNSAQKIGSEPDALIGSVAVLAAPKGKEKVFGAFLRKTPDERRLEHFGLREATTESGEFTYAAAQ